MYLGFWAWTEGDFDGDATVSFGDFVALADSFGRRIL
jgi:hypothetical protein